MVFIQLKYEDGAQLEASARLRSSLYPKWIEWDLVRTMWCSFCVTFDKIGEREEINKNHRTKPFAACKRLIFKNCMCKRKLYNLEEKFRF